MSKQQLTYDEFVKELEKYYTEKLDENPNHVFHRFRETRKYFKDTFKLFRKLFDEYMNKLYEDWQKTGIRFYGSISSDFKPIEWLHTKDGSLYILWGYSKSIRPELCLFSVI